MPQSKDISDMDKAGLGLALYNAIKKWEVEHHVHVEYTEEVLDRLIRDLVNYILDY